MASTPYLYTLLRGATLRSFPLPRMMRVPTIEILKEALPIAVAAEERTKPTTDEGEFVKESALPPEDLDRSLGRILPEVWKYLPDRLGAGYRRNLHALITQSTIPWEDLVSIRMTIAQAIAELSLPSPQEPQNLPDVPDAKTEYWWMLLSDHIAQSVNLAAADPESAADEGTLRRAISGGNAQAIVGVKDTTVVSYLAGENMHEIGKSYRITAVGGHPAAPEVFTGEILKKYLQDFRCHPKTVAAVLHNREKLMDVLHSLGFREEEVLLHHFFREKRGYEHAIGLKYEHH